MKVQFLAVCGPKFMKFLENVGLAVFNVLLPIVYIVFCSEDIRRQVVGNR